MYTCQQVLRSQVQVQVQVLRPQVQVQVQVLGVQVPKLQVQVRVPGFYCIEIQYTSADVSKNCGIGSLHQHHLIFLFSLITRAQLYDDMVCGAY